MPLKIFYISSEVDPFSNTYILSTIAKKVGIKFQDNPEIEISMCQPKYGYISERKYILREVIRLKDLSVDFGDGQKIANLKSTDRSFNLITSLKIYFLSLMYPYFG
jgi:starch synthase